MCGPQYMCGTIGILTIGSQRTYQAIYLAVGVAHHDQQRECRIISMSGFNTVMVS